MKLEGVCAITRQKFARLIFFAATSILALPAAAQETAVPIAVQQVLNESTGLLQRLTVRQKVVEQPDSGFDSGDFYLSPAGKHRLLRIPGALAVRFKPDVQTQEGQKELTAGGGPLQGYSLALDSVKGVMVLHAPARECELQRRDPTRYFGALAKARNANCVRSANPVFIEPDGDLARTLTEEILICLQPSTDPQNYYGADWEAVQRLRGTADTFVLTRAGVTAEALLAEAARHAADPRVAWAQPNFLSQMLKQASDPLFAQQWSLQNNGQNGATVGAGVNATEAWSTTAGNPAIVIAVLDDGIEMNHPDLMANIFSNQGESLNGSDDDANGYVDDLHGWDFYGDDNDPNPKFPYDNHGTAAAGVAAAAGNNDIGVAGVAYQCQIMPLKVSGGDNWVPDSTLAEAIYYAAGRTRDGLGTWRSADVISISLSFPQSSVVDDALLWAATNGRGGKGCPIFAAAGDQASRWAPNRVRIPIGLVTGPGTYRLGFEYSKDLSDSVGEDQVKIDNVALLDGDGLTQLDSPLGPGGRQDFEGPFPPAGWQRLASLDAPLWMATTNRAFTGTGGSRSAQSGAVGNNKWTELRTPQFVLKGDEILSFSCYISSESDYDGLRIWVYDSNDNYLTVFEGDTSAPLITGNPGISSSVHYPASHSAVIAVGASTDADVPADYSAFGPDLDFLAPSSGGWNDIVTTDRTGVDGYADGDYAYDFGGTSAACSLAAGIGALILSVDPHRTASEVRMILRDSCDKIGFEAYDGRGWNPHCGYGRLNAERAVELVSTPFRVTITSPTNDTTLLAPTNVTITALAEDFDGTIVKVEFFAGATKLGEATNAPYRITWRNPPHGTHTLTARATDNRSSNACSASVAVVVMPGISISDATVTEGNRGTTNAAFSMRLSERSSQMISVNYTLVDGSAVGGRDYVPTSGTVVFPPGITNQTIRVAVIGNILSESNKTFFVVITDPVNAGIARGHGLGTILDNHDPVPGISVDDVIVTEGDSGTGDAIFDVRLSTRSGKTITVQYNTTNGSALGNWDFIPTSGTLSFPPGVITQTIAVPVIGDTVSESNETFFLNLNSAVNATIAHGKAAGMILDNDPDPLITVSDVMVPEGNRGTTNAIFTIKLSARSGKTITVNYATANGTAIAGKDYFPTRGVLKFGPGVTSQEIRVAVIGDTLSESNETFFVNLSNPFNANLADGQAIGTILDDDSIPALTISDVRITEANTGTTYALFTVKLSAMSGRTVTVNYASANGTAMSGPDYLPTNGTVVFPPGAISQIVRVAVIGDRLSESNKTFFVNLSNPVNASIADGQGLGTLIDTDPVPALSLDNITLTEGNAGTTNAVFTIRLSSVSGKTITVNYATANGTALSTVDYMTTNGLLTFPPGVSNQTVAVAVIGDTLGESTKTFFLNLSNAVNATIAHGHGICTIVDNDSGISVASVFNISGLPRSATSNECKITATRIVETNVLISFTVPPGQTGRVECSDGPLGPSSVWLPVPGATNILGTGSTITAIHLGGTDRLMRFYRIRILP